MMWRSQMFWRLALSYTFLPLAAIVLLGSAVVNRVERHFLDQTEGELEAKASLVREAIRGVPIDDASALQRRVTGLRTSARARVTVLAADGRVLADSDEDPALMENHSTRPEVQQAREFGAGTTTRYSRTLHRPMMYLALSADGVGGVGFVRVALPLEGVRQHLAGLRTIVGIAALLTGLVATSLAFFLARQVARPLRDLAAAAGHIAAGGFGHTVTVVGTGEVANLARTFNHMSGRLAEQFGQLEEDRQQLGTILANMTEGVIAVDAEERVRFANARAHVLLEVPASTPVDGRKFGELIPQRALNEAVRHILTAADPYRAEIPWNGAAVRNLIVHGARIPGAPTAGAVLVIHDATELRQLERIRQEFVANASHELKTPLSVIKAAAETLLEGAGEDPVHRRLFLDQIATQADRLHALILDLLSLARIEARGDTFEPMLVGLQEKVAACIERHRAKAGAKSQILEAEPPGDGDVAVWADEEAIEQVLDNLVDNALKYTPAGGRIRVHWGADSRSAFLAVEDTGIGIPAADLPRVFERFYRVDKARSRDLGGTGLGLSIVKHLAQAMGGSVAAESQVGSGSTFTVRLPREGKGSSRIVHAPALPTSAHI